MNSMVIRDLELTCMLSNIPFDIGSVEVHRERYPLLPHYKSLQIRIKDLDGLIYCDDIITRHRKGQKYYA